MKITQLIEHKYPQNSDMHRKVNSTRVCMTYQDLIQTTYPELKFSKAKSIQSGTLTIYVGSHTEASQIKLYEYDLICDINNQIEQDMFKVERLRIEVQRI